MGGIVGIDVGGTFTDLYFAGSDAGRACVLKVPSTPSDPSHGLIDALQAADIKPGALDAILHGTTIATNAVIERRGARAALITTAGFRDVLELGRRDRQHMYGLTGVHRPLISRQMRWEVPERMDHRGQVLTPLDEPYLVRLAEALAGEGIESVVVAFLHSYANPAHERRAKDIFLAASNSWEVVISSDVVSEYMEFERISTAVVQGYLQPLVSRYTRQLSGRLGELGFDQQTLVMQSNGGLVPLAQLSDKAANIVRSGPAAGVMAAARIAEEAGFGSVITGDMGGTSYDVAVVVDGEPKIAETTELDFRIPLRLPMIDVHTIGAGGGSIAYLDRGGVLQVGPQSAGAVPGPICFGRGGTAPTVTDANAVLGRINPEHPIGLTHIERLDVEAARRAIGELGAPLSLGVEETAEAILTVVNHVMARRTRLLSVEKGHDPRKFAFVAFGGAGPLHGASIMREVGISTMLLPPHPGVLCALGCAVADMRHDVSQTVELPLGAIDRGFIARAFAAHRQAATEQFAASRGMIDTLEISHAANMSYLGQIHTLRVPVEATWDTDELARAFEAKYREEYGNSLGDIPLNLVGLTTSAVGIRAKPAPKASVERESTPAPRARRDVYFGGWISTPIYTREDLTPGSRFTGPAIVEQPDTTTVIEPGMKARVDAFNNILVELA
ncbi:MAG: hydantoinase/oxoprolinase family protein [Flavobacteriaceae bacterium]